MLVQFDEKISSGISVLFGAAKPTLPDQVVGENILQQKDVGQNSALHEM
jgi:hypothetical protein